MSNEKPFETQPERHDDIVRIGTAMAKMRLMIGRRYIGRLAIARVGAGMELSHLDVLGLVRRIGAKQEVTVGAIAEQMRIDQSRASRVVTELVKRGVLQREVSQEDARRTIVALTSEGADLLSKVTEVKHDALQAALADWAPDDIATFAVLYNRFMTSMEEQSYAFENEQAPG